jgi:hypothetical protein
LQLDSNVTIESALHQEKQLSQRTSADDGITIDDSDEQFENAYDPIRESLQLDSNVTIESALQQEKHLSQRTSTDDGITIDDSDEQSENAFCSIHRS